ncbi:MAG: glutamine-hydrolyzing GMP synthase [Cyanobacteria bacterium NC_groundwater_1444_Ag_S-0.65um_54_12]|nr:glutamine-hydrolyzing GMP synthase [Cyanobacteria bacterium NC_groundwater_1444_Ag_S-0.65um_54_12]
MSDVSTAIDLDTIAILDFGSQYTQLIARRVRELGVFSRIYPHDVSITRLLAPDIRGIILSGGPASVTESGAPWPDSALFSIEKPLLGICYGMQLLNYFHDGTVVPGSRREYGPAEITLISAEPLFQRLVGIQPVWMSHGDHLDRLADDFRVIARTSDGVIAAIRHAEPRRAVYGVQFHPEVTHTPNGQVILENFLFEICGCSHSWSLAGHLERTVAELQSTIGKLPVCVLVSGGVDSTVTAALLARALPSAQVRTLHIDNGLMRAGESVEVLESLHRIGITDVTFVDAAELFLERLVGVTDPEEKRRIIGDTFIAVQERELARLGLGDNKVFLAQGTLYTDLIESGSGVGKQAVVIKTHHNVSTPSVQAKREAGLLVEPNREIFKDEVRALGLCLGLPESLVYRHPFPGPGLAIRILGAVTPERLALLRQVDACFLDELRRNGLYEKIWQAFAVLLPVQSVGVMGDARSYDHVVGLRAVQSCDGMTAQAYPFPWEVLTRLATRLTNEINGVGRVVYDVSSKPPATIEWE